MRRAPRARRGLGFRLRHHRGGAVAVEFALVATILLTLIAASVDLISISGFNREIERSTTQVAAAVTSCPSPSTAGFASCVTDTIKGYSDRKINTLVRYPSMTLSMVQIVEVSNAIRICTGTATYLPTDVSQSALAILNDKDSAIVVLMSMTYQPIFPYLLRVFTGSSTANLRGYTIAVQASNSVVC